MNSSISAGYFGKLPQYSDFIKYNAGGPEIILIDDWIQQGIKSAKLKMKNWKSTYKNSPVYEFVYPFTNTTHLITGIIKPAYDKNEREYPFLTFLTIPFSLFHNNDYYHFPLTLANQFKEMKKLSTDNLSKMNDGVTEIAMNTATNETFPEYLNNSQKVFWENIFTEQSGIIQFKCNLLKLNKSFAAVRLALNSPEGLLESNLSVLITIIANAAKNTDLPAVFWTSSGTLHSVFIFFKPFALQYSDLLDPDNANVFDLNQVSEANILFNDQSTLKELITELKTFESNNA